MIGRSTWKTQNKLLPGIYVRVISSDKITQESSNSTNNPTMEEIRRLGDKRGVLLKTTDGQYLAVIVTN